jgi:hypothetical protein
MMQERKQSLLEAKFCEGLWELQEQNGRMLHEMSEDPSFCLDTCLV